jgi:hypothetical protein
MKNTKRSGQLNNAVALLRSDGGSQREIFSFGVKRR